MKKIKNNFVIFILLSLISISSALSISIEDLINSYNYSYNSDKVNISNINYFGSDTDVEENCSIIFRTNVTQDEFITNTWIAVDANNDNILDAYNYYDNDVSYYYCNDTTSRLVAKYLGYDVRNVYDDLNYIAICTPNGVFYYVKDALNSLNAELLPYPTTPYDSRNQEVFSYKCKSGCNVIYRTNAINVLYDSNTWSALDTNNDNLMEAYGISGRWDYTTDCDDSISKYIGKTFEGYQLRQYKDYPDYILICEPTEAWYFQLNTGESYNADLSTSSKEPYLSQNQEAYGVICNGTGLFNFLIINITANLTDGNYSFVGDLMKDGKILYPSSFNSNFLTNGSYTFYMQFPGKVIEDGNLYLHLNLNRFYLNEYSNPNFTLSLNPSSFERPDLSLDINSYELINSDNDSKYEFLRVNLNINTSNLGLYEIAAYLRNSSAISARNNFTINKTQQNISLDFNASTLRKKRIKNPVLYILTADKGSKISFDKNFQIIYNLADFDAESDIFNGTISESVEDIDGDNRYEKLIFTLGLDIVNGGNYAVEVLMEGSFGEYLIYQKEDYSLSIGPNIIDLIFNGTKIYTSKINGPYKIKYLKLIKDDEVIDKLSDPYTTIDYNYSNFQIPEMPDLIITNITNYTNEFSVTIKNQGKKPAFGIINSFYDENFTKISENIISVLMPDESIETIFIINNSNLSKIFAITDFKNSIDEENESNNQGIWSREASSFFSIYLEAGWNLISLPLSPINKSVKSVFNSIKNNYTSIFVYNSSDVGKEWKSYDPSRPDFLNTLKQVDETNGIWIKANNPSLFSFQGDLNANILFILKGGWNLVGYPTLNTKSVKDILSNVSGQYSSVFMYNASDVGKEWKSYDPARPDFLNTLKNFTQGFGYWIKAKNDTNWTFDGNFKTS